MNFIILLMSTLVSINGINGSPINLMNRREGPDADSVDPVGSGLLRPVFLGKSTGIKRISPSLSSRNIRDRRPAVEEVESEVLEPEEPQHIGLPFNRRHEPTRNEHIFHPDSDTLQGRFGQNVVVDDPLPEMISGGDLAANPFAERPSISSIIGQLLLDSIGL
jgi:hypothetical protein